MQYLCILCFLFLCLLFLIILLILFTLLEVFCLELIERLLSVLIGLNCRCMEEFVVLGLGDGLGVESGVCFGVAGFAGSCLVGVGPTIGVLVFVLLLLLIFCVFL